MKLFSGMKKLADGGKGSRMTPARPQEIRNFISETLCELRGSGRSEPTKA